MGHFEGTVWVLFCPNGYATTVGGHVWSLQMLLACLRHREFCHYVRSEHRVFFVLCMSCWTQVHACARTSKTGDTKVDNILKCQRLDDCLRYQDGNFKIWAMRLSVRHELSQHHFGDKARPRFIWASPPVNHRKAVSLFVSFFFFRLTLWVVDSKYFSINLEFRVRVFN